MLRDNKGVTLIETAITLPIVLFILFAIIAFALWMNVEVTVNNATRAAAREYAVHGCEDTARSAAEHILSTGGLSPAEGDLEIHDEGDNVVVISKFDYLSPAPWLMSLLGGDRMEIFTVTARTVYRKEVLE